MHCPCPSNRQPPSVYGGVSLAPAKWSSILCSKKSMVGTCHAFPSQISASSGPNSSSPCSSTRVFTTPYNYPIHLGISAPLGGIQSYPFYYPGCLCLGLGLLFGVSWAVLAHRLRARGSVCYHIHHHRCTAIVRQKLVGGPQVHPGTADWRPGQQLPGGRQLLARMPGTGGHQPRPRSEGAGWQAVHLAGPGAPKQTRFI